MEKTIKSITIRRFDYIIKRFDDDQPELKEHIHHIIEYNRDGNPLKDTRYSQAGEFEEMNEYEYNDNGEMALDRYYTEPGFAAEETRFFRDEGGKIVKAEKRYLDGSVDTISYEYNEAGKLVIKTTRTDEDEIEQVETFEWDGDTIVNHEVTDGEGSPLPLPEHEATEKPESKITRNEKGQVILEEETDENGEVILRVSRTYNDDGTAHEVEVFQDGRGRTFSRNYFLRYEYTFFE